MHDLNISLLFEVRIGMSCVIWNSLSVAGVLHLFVTLYLLVITLMYPSIDREA